jgi:hypothetical protein
VPSIGLLVRRAPRRATIARRHFTCPNCSGNAFAIDRHTISTKPRRLSVYQFKRPAVFVRQRGQVWCSSSDGTAWHHHTHRSAHWRSLLPARRHYEPAGIRNTNSHRNPHDAPQRFEGHAQSLCAYCWNLRALQGDYRSESKRNWSQRTKWSQIRRIALERKEDGGSVWESKSQKNLTSLAE